MHINQSLWLSDDCMDTQGYCRSWLGRCHKNPRLMKLDCPHSCGFCAVSKSYTIYWIFISFISNFCLKKVICHSPPASVFLYLVRHDLIWKSLECFSPGSPFFSPSPGKKSTICKDECKIVNVGIVSVRVHLKNSHYVNDIFIYLLIYVYLLIRTN